MENKDNKEEVLIPTMETVSWPTFCLKCLFVYDRTKMKKGYLYVHCDEYLQ